ncbi:hypothetical protein HJG54_11935 [Leptolyngbya sp. NK1-12]|uniref:Smf/DprA SLOG domain-containing protein n=1 Tax=Leptolyngbya sp. NK1-12 TaxID=2547451 RepID=A0AA97AI60_9CYAN|nr:hypothetical protein HJG54_11935 [Leptolyngbya sp. NK1-12]
MLQNHSLPPDHPLYPDALRQFRADPLPLSTIGNLQLLQRPKLAFFCSSECPDDVWSQTRSLMVALPAEIAVISGFHAPVEKQALSLLLQRTQAVIFCPARSLDGMKLTAAWQTGVAEHRLLLLSIFSAKQSRATAKLAQTRNQLVATLADAILIAHATSNGKIAALAHQWQEQGKSLFVLDTPINQALLKQGAKPITSVHTLCDQFLPSSQGG